MPAPKKSSKDKKWLWGDADKKAFEELKVALPSPPVLGYPDYQTHFEMYVDASQAGLGTVLFQQQKGHVGLFAMQVEDWVDQRSIIVPLSWNFWHLNGPILRSSTTTCTETISRYTKTYIPLTYILTTAKLDATGLAGILKKLQLWYGVPSWHQ